MRRQLAIGTVLALAVLTLTACSPPDIGTIGIARQGDGSLEVLIRMCRGSVSTMILNAVNSFPSSVDGGDSDEWESVPDMRAPLSPSITGDAQFAMPFDEEALRSDVLYRLWASGREGNAFSGFFGASELAAVEAGQVLAPGTSESGGVMQVVSPDEFETIADDFCD
jgi:hypothetical protein